MSDVQQMTQLLAPFLVTMMEEPFWVSVCRPTPVCDGPAAEPLLDFWSGPGFENWSPDLGCEAIIAVTPATTFAVTVPAASRSRRPARTKVKPACAICAVSAEGEAYAALVLPGGRQLAEGVPASGRLLDIMLDKFGLPPGPPCPFDLEITPEPT
jgi:hypothetical protein